MLLAGVGAVGYAQHPGWRETYATDRFLPVNSTVFASAKYDVAAATLTLLFRDGRAYEFRGVSHKTFYTFMKVRSKGSFFNAHIRHHYECRHIGDAP